MWLHTSIRPSNSQYIPKYQQVASASTDHRNNSFRECIGDILSAPPTVEALLDKLPSIDTELAAADHHTGPSSVDDDDDDAPLFVFRADESLPEHPRTSVVRVSDEWADSTIMFEDILKLRSNIEGPDTPVRGV